MNKTEKQRRERMMSNVNVYSVRRDEWGHAVAIERNGYTVLHLQPGTERNEREVQDIVDRLNLTNMR